MSFPIPKQWLLTGERSKCRVMICKHCGVELVTYSKTRIYCSQKCYYHKTPEERFNANVIKGNAVDDCWNWKAVKDRDGYGLFRMGKEQRAHRVAWIFANGQIPDGLCVLHQCDNPPCCNPNHLFLGTNADNQRDMILKGRSNPPKGERSGLSKLTTSQVLEIRRLHAIGSVTQRKLALDFNIGFKAINKIVLRQRWAHV